MQYDDRIARVLTALTKPRQRFEAALMDATAELRSLLDEQRAPVNERIAHEALRLGEFAAGHLDAARFNALIAEAEVIDPMRFAALEKALAVLTLFSMQGDRLFQLCVEEGNDLRDAVRDALTARGGVFDAAHHVERVRQVPAPGGSDITAARSSAPPSAGSGTLPYRRWSRLERALAPPLLVEVRGADLYVTGLAEYLDGSQKIVLVVSGPTAPAPLARLIAPRTFVMQTTDPAALDRFGDFDGPGIAAVMPDGAATFLHDPSRGATLARRLEIGTLPEIPKPGAAAGTRGQQAEDLDWLRELAALAAAAAEANVGQAHDDPAAAPADQLAGWLLSFGNEAVT
jgi:hypothetical protein